VLNERDDLSIFADGAFDFVFSFLVLQHMPPPLAESYLREFVRVLKPGGIGYFQMPKYSRNPVKRILMKHAPIEALFWLLRHRSRQPFQMYGRDLDEIVAVIDRAGADGVGVRTESYGREFWLDHRIVLRKRLWRFGLRSTQLTALLRLSRGQWSCHKGRTESVLRPGAAERSAHLAAATSSWAAATTVVVEVAPAALAVLIACPNPVKSADATANA
jgi:hypothetical protein